MLIKINQKVVLFIFSLICCIPTLALTANVADKSAELKSIQWQSWQDGVFKQAKKEHRLILLYVYATWCHWCQQMESTTWKNKAVIQYVNSTFIPAKSDSDKDVSLLARYQVVDLPSFVIIDENGKAMKLISGYLSPEDVMLKVKVP